MNRTEIIKFEVYILESLQNHFIFFLLLTLLLHVHV